MNPWHKLPFLRLIIPFLTGILLGIRGIMMFDGIVAVIVTLLFIQLVMVLYHRRLFSFSYRWIGGLLIYVFFLMAGIWRAYENYRPYKPNYYDNYRNPNEKQLWLVKISGPVSIRDKSIRALSDVLYLIDNKSFKKTDGKLMLSMERDSASAALTQGDLVLVKAYLKEIPGPAFPCAFDYARFSANKGILYQVYLRNGDWKLHQRNKAVNLRYMAWKWQQKLVGIIREQSLDRDEQAVGCAMLLGYTDGFGQDLQGAYSRAGVTHILSVSGLHVGLVFIICSRMLFFLNRNKTQKILKIILLILLTWLYCLLTGLAPCVQRAGVMFTFLIIGQSLGRKNNLVNVLFASAFILLFINPSNIFDYGFQLSYLAVLGIVWLEPLIYPMLYIKNKYLDKLWKLTSVTLAAQIATAPMASFHFHQFPTWFIPANLIVIPLSTLVMYLGICLLVTTTLPLISNFFGICFGLSIRLMNFLIGFADRLPLTVIEGLYPDPVNVILCFMFIAFMALWLTTSTKSWALLSLICLLCYSTSLFINSLHNKTSSEMVFFQYNKNDWSGIIHGKSLHLFSSPVALSDSSQVKIKLKQWLLKTRNQSISWHSDSVFHQTSGKKAEKINTVFWLNRKISPDKHLVIRPSYLILGGNLTYKIKQKWIWYCECNNIPYQDVRNKGCILLPW